MSELQQNILTHASKAVKPGGVLVYATCSMFEKENKVVVKEFLKNNSDFIADPFINPLSDKETDGSLNIMPWHVNCDAMFLARFKRKK